MSLQEMTPLDVATHIGMVSMAVSDLPRSLAFYQQVIGLSVLEQSPQRALLGAGGVALLELQHQAGAIHQATYTTGLFHVAILLPTRQDLGRVLLNLLRHNARIGGGDHYVSEAIYLNDPDGNGLEIYRDRPRDEWRWQDGQVDMDTVELDFQGIVDSVPNPSAPFNGMPDGTTIGHIHLKVGDIAQAEAFYHAVLGFDIVAHMQSASFVSAGGYHHHLGMNVWQSAGAPPASPHMVGLRFFEIVLPSQSALAALVARLQHHNIPHQTLGDAVQLQDPYQNVIRLVVKNK